jgi:hypothetical protein
MSEFIEALRSPGPKVFNPLTGVPAFCTNRSSKGKGIAYRSPTVRLGFHPSCKRALQEAGLPLWRCMRQAIWSYYNINLKIESLRFRINNTEYLELRSILHAFLRGYEHILSSNGSIRLDALDKLLAIDSDIILQLGIIEINTRRKYTDLERINK